MTPARTSKRLRAVVRDLGLRIGLLYILHRGCERFKLPAEVRSYRLVAQPVRARDLLSSRRRGRYTAREIHRGEPALADMPIDAATRDFRFGQGAVCLGLFKDTALAAYLWLALDRYEEDEVRCVVEMRPAGQTAWDFDVFVLPRHRGSFAFLALWDAANAYLRARERSWTLSRISAFNSGSVQSHRALGAKDIGSAHFFRMGSLQLMLSSHRPKVHLSFRRPPHLVISPPSGNAPREA